MNFLRDIQSLAERGPTERVEEECPDCDGYGYIVTDNDVRICHCLAERQLRKRLKKANIPKRYLSKSLENFKNDTDQRRNALQRVRRYVKEFDSSSEKGGLFLLGAAGTGKTHLAVAALKELIEQGHTGLFYNSANLIRDFRNRVGGSNTEEEKDRLDRLVSVDILVIDDLGVTKLSDFVREQTYSIIDQRYSENKTLIVTSNLNMKELEEQVTYPVFSRVCGMCSIVNPGDIDFRIGVSRNKSR
ncbi:MAG: ATP-binding protein [Candidatus Omnitrophica bacterium]|nr:ATP-binding protein [Candidatus Omnitrophota bacterium]